MNSGDPIRPDPDTKHWKISALISVIFIFRINWVAVNEAAAVEHLDGNLVRKEH